MFCFSETFKNYAKIASDNISVAQKIATENLVVAQKIASDNLVIAQKNAQQLGNMVSQNLDNVSRKCWYSSILFRLSWETWIKNNKSSKKKLKPKRKLKRRVIPGLDCQTRKKLRYKSYI